MLLELLSHQNFADMKYGLDPTFRFTVSRSIYKGMLKYLSNRYGIPYEVQPLPVESMGVAFGQKGNAVVSWVPVSDELEPTAAPEGYILYTRIDEGGFDNGKVIKPSAKAGRLSTEVAIEPGHIYSFRIAAFNDGGMSFPSETVSIGRPAGMSSDGTVLIVNNFDRVSAPAFFDSPTIAGFDNRMDSGVPHIRDIAYIGDMYQIRRQAEYISNDNPGFGACDSGYAGWTVAGNTFDFIKTHGKAMMKAGYAFYSCSNEAFCTDSTFRKGAWCVDLICGKQVTTPVGSGMKCRYEVFPEEMQTALEKHTIAGGNVLISGAYIATDVWDSIYPVSKDDEKQKETIKFVQNTLGYRWGGNCSSRKGVCEFVRNGKIADMPSSRMEICNEINPEMYCVESPDGIVPASAKGFTIMRYSDTGIGAGICHDGGNYRTACLGFPIESLSSEDDIDTIVGLTLDFFEK